MKTLISLLSGDIVLEDGRWRSNDLTVRGGHAESALDSFRVSAAAALLQESPEAVVFIHGGLADATHPTLASVMRNELIALGIAPERMLLEERSQKTVQQLRELQATVLQQHPKSIKILSNDWHLPRVKAMVEYLSELAPLYACAPEYVEAEAVLLAQDPVLWGPRLAAVRQRADVQAVIAQELRGLEQIRRGTYKYG